MVALFTHDEMCVCVCVCGATSLLLLCQGYNDLSAAGVEVCAPEGSCVVFNPMSLHSASNHTRPSASPRHVVACSFSHCREAGYLQQQTREIRYVRS
jgi:hypothetical protein